MLKDLNIFNVKWPKNPEQFDEDISIVLKEKTKSSYKSIMGNFTLPEYKKDLKKDIMSSLGGGQFQKIQKI